MEAIHGKEAVKSSVGADLSSCIKGKGAGPIVGPDGKPRTGVFFMSNDMITVFPDMPRLRDIFCLSGWMPKTSFRHVPRWRTWIKLPLHGIQRL
jgi:hypothetical protein